MHTRKMHSSDCRQTIPFNTTKHAGKEPAFLPKDKNTCKLRYTKKLFGIINISYFPHFVNVYAFFELIPKIPPSIPAARIATNLKTAEESKENPPVKNEMLMRTRK